MLKKLCCIVIFFTHLFCLELILPQSLKDLDSIDVKEYFVSEKLDGVRGYWDGKNLLSKTGKNLNPPQWFIKNFPPFAIDGELFTNRGEFEKIVSIIKSKQKQWQELKFFVFEVPNQKGDLLQRLEVIQKFLEKNPNAPIAIIPQHQFDNAQMLKDFLDEIQKANGEGIILRKKHTPYQTGRNASALKYKFFFDAECQIIDYQKGKGKYANLVGAIICKDEKHTFKIGSGFDDNFRKNPPKIGTFITYKYYKTTKNHLPKHPVFLRIYNDF